MKQINLFSFCLLIFMTVGVNLSAQNVQINQSLKDKTFQSERVLEIKNVTNAEERLVNIANNSEAQEAYDEKLANSDQNPSASPQPQTVTIERNLENSTTVDVQSIRNNGNLRQKNFDFEKYRSTIGTKVNKLKGK